jgi:hypothetical protein
MNGARLCYRLFSTVEVLVIGRGVGGTSGFCVPTGICTIISELSPKALPPLVSFFVTKFAFLLHVGLHREDWVTARAGLRGP